MHSKCCTTKYENCHGEKIQAILFLYTDNGMKQHSERIGYGQQGKKRKENQIPDLTPFDIFGSHNLEEKQHSFPTSCSNLCQPNHRGKWLESDCAESLTIGENRTVRTVWLLYRLIPPLHHVTDDLSADLFVHRQDSWLSYSEWLPTIFHSPSAGHWTAVSKGGHQLRLFKLILNLWIFYEIKVVS